MDLTAFQQIGIATGLGLLVGLQREWASRGFAGIRTFPMITVLGTLCGLFGANIGSWFPAVGLLSLAGFVIMINVLRERRNTEPGEEELGLTTEVAALLMFTVGLGLTTPYSTESLAVGGGVAVLLHFKKSMHSFVQRLAEADLTAAIRLVLIALVILPVLPNETYGPYDVLNPFEIWLMVVLIVGIGLAAWIARKLMGERVGVLMSGVLGGLISSTATTVSLARQVRAKQSTAVAAAVIISLASAVVFVRVLFEVVIVAPSLLRSFGPPLGALLGVMFILAATLFLWFGKRSTATADGKPPSDLTAAVVFGLLYALVLFGVAAAREHFGDAGLYSVAVLSGLTDMDAITLSTANLVQSGRLDADTGWRLVICASLSNLVLKGSAVALLGNRQLTLIVSIVFGVAIAAGAAIVLFWP